MNARRKRREPSEVWTPSEVHDALRVPEGVVIDAARNGKVRHRTYDRAGRTCYLISIEDARREWGPK